MYTRRLVTVLIGLGILILVVILFFKALSGGDNDVVEQPTPITSYVDTATEMQMLASGPIVAESEHQAVRISVGRDEVRVEVITGYNGEVVREQSFSNSQEAYDQFLHALDLYGYTKGMETDTQIDKKGRCATGARYTFSIVDGAREIDSSWTTSCSGKSTFKGSRSNVLRLFRQQVPSEAYRELTRGVRVPGI